MSLSIGIVGFPNVGKSTLFNALLKQQTALAANYPFATIEPNVGIAQVPDTRLEKLAEIVGTTVIKPATVEFVDIAGLVKGASKGEGLGNQFLANIRETSAICHVVRAFSDASILREGTVDPKHDLEAIRTELALADLATLEKQPEPKGRADKALQERWQVVQQFGQWLNDGESLVKKLAEGGTQHQLAVAKELTLLTAKPEIIAVNVDEEQLADHQQLQQSFATELKVDVQQVVIVSAKVESELAVLSDEDQADYLAEFGLDQGGLERLVQTAYRALHLQSFLTAGEKEVRAWTILLVVSAPEAAGVIHSDFEKHFINAHFVGYDDFVSLGGWKGVKEAGKLRLEGRDYMMQEDDVVEFMIGR